MPGVWFDELVVGQVFEHPIRRTVTETDNVLFSAMTHNPAQLHLDEEYMKGTPFGQRLVNSAFTLGLMVGISVGDTTLGTAVANLGWDEVRFPGAAVPRRHRPCRDRGDRAARFEIPPRSRDRHLSAPGVQPARRACRLVQALGPATAPAGRGMTMPPLRSWLFIPGDSEKKIAKVDATPADAFIFDLEDAVAPARKPIAREMVPAFLADRPKASRRSQLWVRVNPLDTPWTLEDLAAIVPAAPDGIVLPKVDGPEDVAQVSHYLSALETAAGIEVGSIRILPVATETAIAPFRLGDYAAARLDRLYGLTWGAEDLSSAIGASSNTDATGQWALTYRLVRSLCLLGAHAAGGEAVETLYVDFRDPEGLRASCRAARAEGFSGRLAIHPAQVEIINEAFSPSDDEIALARRVVDLFAASPDAGTLALDGRMLDIPHLKQAERTLAQHAARHG